MSLQEGWHGIWHVESNVFLSVRCICITGGQTSLCGSWYRGETPDAPSSWISRVLVFVALSAPRVLQRIQVYKLHLADLSLTNWKLLMQCVERKCCLLIFIHKLTNNTTVHEGGPEWLDLNYYLLIRTFIVFRKIKVH